MTMAFSVDRFWAYFFSLQMRRFSDAEMDSFSVAISRSDVFCYSLVLISYYPFGSGAECLSIVDFTKPGFDSRRPIAWCWLRR